MTVNYPSGREQAEEVVLVNNAGIAHDALIDSMPSDECWLRSRS